MLERVGASARYFPPSGYTELATGYMSTFWSHAAPSGNTQGDDASSGVLLLRTGLDAFAARLVMARAAQRTLDVQYYIWHDDLSGLLMLAELKAAADRGVSIRLLLDDLGVPRMDARIAYLNQHPNIEVRLYNPFRIRRFRTLNWLFDARRLNHRMHAKSLTVDGAATIVGGRNIGDEYFGAREDALFADLDAIAVGPVVDDVREAFDRTWHHPLARLAHDVIHGAGATGNHELELLRVSRSGKAREYLDAVKARPLFDELSRGEFDATWAPVRLVQTLPDPQAEPKPEVGLASLLPPTLATPSRELNVVSGYFVPTSRGIDDLVALARSGVSIRVLTNCYAATDVGIVHAGYAPTRRRLLEGGVELFEMPAPDDKPKTFRKFVRPGSAFARSAREPGGTLHAKAISVDGTEFYVGSSNFDPRSACINTELGILVEDGGLATGLSELFTEEIAQSTYRLTLGERGEVVWIDERDDVPEASQVEPGTNVLSRSLVRALSLLPIERLL